MLLHFTEGEERYSRISAVLSLRIVAFLFCGVRYISSSWTKSSLGRDHRGLLATRGGCRTVPGSRPGISAALFFCIFPSLGLRGRGPTQALAPTPSS